MNMKLKQVYLVSLLLFSYTFCQSQKINFKISNLASGIKSVEITSGNIILLLDENENISSVNSLIGGTFDYWSDGFGVLSGKIRSIGNINIDYWSGGSGVLSGNIKSFGDISIDYWSDGFGILSGKVRSIGNISIDYWPDGFGVLSGKIRSIIGNSSGMFVTIE